MPTTSLVTLRQKIIKKLYAPRHPITSTSTTGGTATTIVDPIWGPASQDVDPLKAWIYCFTAGGWAVGDVARVINWTYGTNTLTVAGALAAGGALATPTTAFDYEVHYKFHPVRIHERINEVLETLRHDIWLPLTLITDGDMQTSGVGSWAATGSTRAKQTTGTGVQFGTQCLRVTNSAAGANTGLVTGASLNLAPGTEVFCAAMVQTVSGTSSDAHLEFYDVTNSAIIKKGFVDTLSRGNTLIAFRTTVPATSTAQTVRLRGTASDSVIDWNFAVVLPIAQRQFAFPTSLEWSEDYTGMFFLEVGKSITVGSSESAFNAFEHTLRKWGETQVFKDDAAVIPFRIEYRGPTRSIDKVLFIKGRVDYTVFTTTGATADAETTTAPDDIVIDLTYADLLEEWANELRDNDQLEEAARKDAKAIMVRERLHPRMQQFFKPRAVVQGTRRRGEPL